LPGRVRDLRRGCGIGPGVAASTRMKNACGLLMECGWTTTIYGLHAKRTSARSRTRLEECRRRRWNCPLEPLVVCCNPVHKR